MTETVRATVYLQLEAELHRYSPRVPEVQSDIVGAKVVNSTQRRSAKPKPGTVEVKIQVEIPKSAFLALRPEAIVVIPDGMTLAHPIEVEAFDPNDKVVDGDRAVA